MCNEYLIPESRLQIFGVPISCIVTSQAVASLKLVVMVVSPGGVKNAWQHSFGIEAANLLTFQTMLTGQMHSLFSVLCCWHQHQVGRYRYGFYKITITEQLEDFDGLLFQRLVLLSLTYLDRSYNCYTGNPQFTITVGTSVSISKHCGR